MQINKSGEIESPKIAEGGVQNSWIKAVTTLFCKSQLDFDWVRSLRQKYHKKPEAVDVAFLGVF